MVDFSVFMSSLLKPKEVRRDRIFLSRVHKSFCFTARRPCRHTSLGSSHRYWLSSKSTMMADDGEASKKRSSSSRRHTTIWMLLDDGWRAGADNLRVSSGAFVGYVLPLHSLKTRDSSAQQGRRKSRLSEEGQHRHYLTYILY